MAPMKISLHDRGQSSKFSIPLPSKLRGKAPYFQARIIPNQKGSSKRPPDRHVAKLLKFFAAFLLYWLDGLSKWTRNLFQQRRESQWHPGHQKKRWDFSRKSGAECTGQNGQNQGSITKLGGNAQRLAKTCGSTSQFAQGCVENIGSHP